MDNKYDSVAFRLWTLKVIEETGKRVFVRFVTIEDIDNGIIIGN